ncbi:MAG: P-loop NTPase [Nitrososphaeria archaeon]
MDERLAEVRNITIVSSAKGGVGKSLTASTLAVILARQGLKVGLLDLDFTSPAIHLILGIKEVFPVEERGIIPPKIYGIKFMSIVHYTKDHMLPLRGADFSNSFIEMLAITRWGSLDFLLIDMPPGIGDATLDAIRFMKKPKFLVIATPSVLALSAVLKLLELLKATNVPVLGVIENMRTDRKRTIKGEIEKHGTTFLGSIYLDNRIEESIGNVDKLINTRFARSLKKIISNRLNFT